jgi:hypothetical protein
MCSQIWLIPLVDNRQCGYITKLVKQKMYFAPDTKYIDVGFDGSLLHAGIRECLSI